MDEPWPNKFTTPDWDAFPDGVLFCPFCAGGNIVIEPEFDGEGDLEVVRVECQSCHASVPHGYVRSFGPDLNYQRALEAWNRRRTPDDAMTARMRKLAARGGLAFNAHQVGRPIPIEAIPADEVSSDIPPLGLAMYIVATHGWVWSQFCLSHGLDPETVQQHIAQCDAYGARLLQDLFGYSLDFWTGLHQTGNRELLASWRRWIAEGLPK